MTIFANNVDFVHIFLSSYDNLKFWYIDRFVNVCVTVENFLASGFGISNLRKFESLIGTLTSFSK